MKGYQAIRLEYVKRKRGQDFSEENIEVLFGMVAEDFCTQLVELKEAYFLAGNKKYRVKIQKFSNGTLRSAYLYSGGSRVNQGRITMMKSWTDSNKLDYKDKMFLKFLETGETY